MEELTPDEKLFSSIIERNFEGMKEALGEGANVNARNDGGQTPLQMAIFYDGGDNIIDTLLAAQGLDVTIADNQGYTPLHMAVMKKNVRVVNELLEKGALVDAVSTFTGSSPLSLSAEERFRNGVGDDAIYKALRPSAGGKRRRSRTNKKTRKANKKRHTARRRR